VNHDHDETTPAEKRGRSATFDKWVVKMPGWSHSSPVVIGKRTIVEAEPDTTCCVDADTGKILWSNSVDRRGCPTGNQIRAHWGHPSKARCQQVKGSATVSACLTLERE
jgi:outer membrane protein assembly factor BamB